MYYLYKMAIFKMASTYAELYLWRWPLEINEACLRFERAVKTSHYLVSVKTKQKLQSSLEFWFNMAA